MKVWIPGGEGMIGKALQEECRQKQISFLSTSHAEIDISCLPSVEQFIDRHNSVTHIANCAAYTNVDLAEENATLARQANAVGPENLGIAAKKKGLALLHLSTDYIFGSLDRTPCKEEALACPLSVYAKTKKEGEERLLIAFPQACIVRTSWVFGIGERSFVSSLWRAMKREVKVQVVSDQWSRPTYAKDLAKTLLSLLEKEGLFHFANQGACSRYDIACALHKILQEKGEEIRCKEIEKIGSSLYPTAAKRPSFSILDTEKIVKMLGVIPRNWEDALREFVDDCKS